MEQHKIIIHKVELLEKLVHKFMFSQFMELDNLAYKVAETNLKTVQGLELIAFRLEFRKEHYEIANNLWKAYMTLADTYNIDIREITEEYTNVQCKIKIKPVLRSNLIFNLFGLHGDI